MIEVEIFRVGRTWRYRITTERKGKVEPGILKLGCASKFEAIQEAKKMIANIIKPCEEVVWRQ
jgi:hypothetical protein